MALKPVYVLIKNLFFAEKIVKTAKMMGLEARTYDSAERLIQSAREKEPALVILDCEGSEKEAFQLLAQFRSDEWLSKIPRIGYLSGASQALKREMRNVGCLQVYGKVEFTRELENLFGRYAHGVSYRL